MDKREEGLGLDKSQHGEEAFADVSDHFVETTVKTILAAARTGEVGDGKVFVLPVEKIYRIRTGEEDRAAVTPVQVAAAGKA